MMRGAGVTGSKYTLNSVITIIAMVYSIFAIYSSGGSAVMGGVLVLTVGYVIWGLIAPRFITTKSSPI